jgi:hypothetical protein
VDIDPEEVDRKEEADHKNSEAATIKEVDGTVVHKDMGIGDLDMEVKVHMEEMGDIPAEVLATLEEIATGKPMWK